MKGKTIHFFFSMCKPKWILVKVVPKNKRIYQPIAFYLRGKKNTSNLNIFLIKFYIYSQTQTLTLT